MTPGMQKISKALRWYFLITFLLSLVGLSLGLLLSLRLDSWQLPYLEELFLSSIIWLLLSSTGLLAVHVLGKKRFIRTMSLCGVLIALLIPTWVILFALESHIHYWKYDQFFDFMLLVSPLPVLISLGGYILSLETESAVLQRIKIIVAINLILAAPMVFLTNSLSMTWWLEGAINLFAVVAVSSVPLLPFFIGWDKRPRKGTVRTISRKLRLTMTCPECDQWQIHRPGPARCGDCGLRYIVEIKEPRCDCGYLLYQLQSNTCPECGKAFEAIPTM